MRKRISRLFVLIIFSAYLGVTVWNMPRMSTNSTVGLLGKTTDTDEVDYSRISEKELLVLAYDGDSEACYRLGVRYDYGIEGTSQNFTSAIGWYRAADAYGYNRASSAIGYLYLNGCGVDADINQAISYFDRAISLYDTEGYVGIGRCALAVLDSDETAAERAFSNFSVAAEKEDLDGIYYLGYVYEKGIGCVADPDKAISYYQSVTASDSKETEDQFAINEAYTRLGLMALSETTEKLDKSNSISYLESAADRKYAPAEYYLGVIYEKGLGVKKDYDTALSWLESAAQRDYAPALNEIGYMYFNGLGVDVDYEQALYYQKLAAALGYEKAQVNLGYLYENGYGVAQNLETALEYYEMASDNSYPGAEEALARVQSGIEGMQTTDENASTEGMEQ